MHNMTDLTFIINRVRLRNCCNFSQNKSLFRVRTICEAYTQNIYIAKVQECSIIVLRKSL